MRQPVKCPRTGMWLARITAPDGAVVQIGRFELKRDAQKAISEAIKRGRRPGAAPFVSDFFEEWLERFPRQSRTQGTNEERIRRYILPNLPHKGKLPIDELRRSALRNAQAKLLKKGLAKETVDGAFSSLSAMLRDAVDDELLETNPAHGLRVRTNDPRLKPTREPRQRRSVPPEEIGAFMAAVEPKYLALCWIPFLTGCRPGEVFGLSRLDIDRPRNMIFVHQTVDRYGHLQPGTKTTHHVRDREQRGRWTLFPTSLLTLVDSSAPHFDGRLFPSPRGKYWSHRNFYRDVWEPAAAVAGTEFTLYDARHTFSSRLLAAGLPLLEVSAWMGHALRAGGEHLNTTARTYAHATGDRRTEALHELDIFVRLVNRVVKQKSRGAVRPSSDDERSIVQLQTAHDDRSKVENVNGDQTVTKNAQ